MAVLLLHNKMACSDINGKRLVRVIERGWLGHWRRPPTGPLPPVNKELLAPSNRVPIQSSYIIKEKLGHGSWGSVHLAVERNSGALRAVKKVCKRAQDELPRFRAEIHFLRGLDHPGVIRLHETFEDFGYIYMVTEYCAGGELFEKLVMAKYFSEPYVATLMKQILSVVCYLHRKQIAHRDLKPENFLFVTRQENSPIKLIDFGLGKRFSSRRKMRTKLGTLYYVPPELLSGQYDEKCDLWSAGIIMYVLLTGVPPFIAADESGTMTAIMNAKLDFHSNHLWSDVSDVAIDLLRRLLTTDPERRLSAEAALAHPFFRLFGHPLLLIRNGLQVINANTNNNNNNNSYQNLHNYHWHCPPNDQYITQKSRRRTPLNAVAAGGIALAASTAAAPPTVSRGTTAGGGVRAGCPAIAVPSTGGATAGGGAPPPRRPSSLTTTRYSDTDDSDKQPKEEDLYALCVDDAPKLISLVQVLLHRWVRYAQADQLTRTAIRLMAQQVTEASCRKFRLLREFFMFADTHHEGFLTATKLMEAYAALKDLSNTRKRSIHSNISTSCLNNDDIDASTAEWYLTVPAASAVEPRSGQDYIEDQSPTGTAPPIYISDASDNSDVSSDDEEELSNPAKREGSSCSSSRQRSASLPHLDFGFDDRWAILNNDSELMKLRELLTYLSLDGTQTIEYSDFLAASADLNYLVREEKYLKCSFHIFDRDSDGNISRRELRSVLGWDDGTLFPGDWRLSQTAIEAELDRIYSTYGSPPNEDSIITYESYKRVLQSFA